MHQMQRFDEQRSAEDGLDYDEQVAARMVWEQVTAEASTYSPVGPMLIE